MIEGSKLVKFTTIVVNFKEIWRFLKNPNEIGL